MFELNISTVLTFVYYGFGHNFLGFYGSLSFWMYLISYNAMKIRSPQWFVERLVPNGFYKGIDKMHLLVSYMNSTVHAMVLGSVVSLYLLDVCSYVWLENSFKFSIGYFMADIIYLFDENISHDHDIVSLMMMLLHHIFTINCENLIFVIDDSLMVFARYIMARFCLAELAVIPLNYSWYLINTRQTHTMKFKIASGITFIAYLLSRVINFTSLFYELFMLEHYKYMLMGSPVVLLNYYWFYKLIRKIF